MLHAKLRGLPFAKMTGSGNDFVFFDGREVDVTLVKSPEAIKAICNRHNGIGADGIVVLEPIPADHGSSGGGDLEVRVSYFNSDGTPADLCGNATLCSTTMSSELGIGAPDGMKLRTPSGLIASRISEGLPAIQLQPVRQWQTAVPIELVNGESRVGFIIAGIPHLVVLCSDAESVDVAGRGPLLRWHPEAGPTGANVNWVSALPDGNWRYRTFERGVEGETLACGTGAVATAILLNEWGLAGRSVTIRTTSGRDLGVRLTSDGSQYIPTLQGEGRVVFRGRIADISI
jgi:diaminopimelate epimerase